MKEAKEGHPATRRWGWLGKGIVGVAVVTSAAIAATAFMHFVDLKFRDGIQVAGSATRRIRSDRAMWSCSVSARAVTLEEAYRELQDGVPRVRQFLIDQGFSVDEIAVHSVSTNEVHALDPEQGFEIPDQIVLYELEQSVTVTTSNIDLVGEASQNVTQLIEGGVHLTSFAPAYIYSDLGEVKIRLVGEATADARSRASEVASNSNATLGELVSARVGVIQVNAANETSVSWDGNYDRTSVDKDVMVVVHTMFTLD